MVVQYTEITIAKNGVGVRIEQPFDRVRVLGGNALSSLTCAESVWLAQQLVRVARGVR